MSLFQSLTSRLAAAGLVVVATFAAGLYAGSMLGAPGQRAEVETIIRDYLMKNPDVLRLALEEMERHGKQEEESKRRVAVQELAPQIFNSKFQTVLGNPSGKIQLVEFFDYNCGYCKRALEDLDKLIKANSDLRVVLKEFPVLGPGSVEAAQVALALHKQFDGAKYWEFHRTLLGGRGQVGKTQALEAAKAAGADMARLEADMQGPDVRAGLAEVMQIADTLGMNGTPSYVVGSDIVIGAVGFEQLQGKIESVRKCGRTAC